MGSGVKGYVVANVSVDDAEGYERDRPRTAVIIARYGGRFLVRGGAVEVREGRSRHGSDMAHLAEILVAEQVAVGLCQNARRAAAEDRDLAGCSGPPAVTATLPSRATMNAPPV